MVDNLIISVSSIISWKGSSNLGTTCGLSWHQTRRCIRTGRWRWSNWGSPLFSLRLQSHPLPCTLCQLITMTTFSQEQTSFLQMLSQMSSWLKLINSRCLSQHDSFKITLNRVCSSSAVVCQMANLMNSIVKSKCYQMGWAQRVEGPQRCMAVKYKHSCDSYITQNFLYQKVLQHKELHINIQASSA